jgi:hypothetical protein
VIDQATAVYIMAMIITGIMIISCCLDLTGGAAMAIIHADDHNPGQTAVSREIVHIIFLKIIHISCCRNVAGLGPVCMISRCIQSFGVTAVFMR